MCRRCWVKYIASDAVVQARRTKWRNERLKQQWDNTGSLYTHRWELHAAHDIREESDLPELVDLPIAPYEPHGEQKTWWPSYPDAGEEMTLEQIGQVLGVSRERVRQIEYVALKKLRHALETLDAAGERRMRVEFLKRYGFLGATKPRPKPPPPETKTEGVKSKKEKGMNPKWHRDNLGIPKDGLLAREAAELLGWPVSTFHQRTAGVEPAGTVKSWTGQPWGYWTLDQIEALKTRFDQVKSKPPRRPRVVKAKPPVISSGDEAAIRRELGLNHPYEAFPALLVVKAKVSGIPMTIPVFVQQMARADDGNHQVKIKFPGNIKDSIHDNTIVVWAKDLLAADYSPFKTPWD